MEKPYHVVADGFSSAVANSFNLDVFRVSQEQQAFLDSFVEQQLNRAKERGGLFYDGDLIGMLMGSIKPKGWALCYDLQTMKYSQHRAMFMRDPEAPIQAFYVNMIGITRDEKLLFGTNQAVLADHIGQLSLVAGGVEIGKSGFPRPREQINKELAEETIRSVTENSLVEVQYGWINGASKRDSSYHLTLSFVAHIEFSSAEIEQRFEEAMQSLPEEERKKAEFKHMVFLPNDYAHLNRFVAEQDSRGQNGNMAKKSVDVLDEWASTYNCDPERLKESKKSGARVYLPQPKF